MTTHQNVENWERAASIAAGLALLGWAARHRHRGHAVARGSAIGVGVGLLGRGAAGYCPVNAALGRHRRLDDTRDALGGHRGEDVAEAVTIARPPADVFAFWRDPGNMSRFMRDVEQVTAIDDVRWHWKVRGPGGVRLEFDSELINVEDNRLIGWRTLPGASVASAGSVQFRPHGESSTEVKVHLQYATPGGPIGSAVAWLTGHAPGSRLREDLRRLKACMEAGETPTVQGQPSGHRRPINLPKWVDA